MTAVASLITALMLGSLSSIIPGLNPMDYFYRLLYSKSLPEYLYDGFGAIGYFSIIYSFISLLISPIYCLYGIKQIDITFDRLSKEDIVYLPLLYLVYIYVIYVKGYLSVGAALVGIIAIILPLIYRLITYFVSDRLQGFKTSCYYQLAVFVVSLFLAIPVTVLYEIIIHTILSAI